MTERPKKAKQSDEISERRGLLDRMRAAIESAQTTRAEIREAMERVDDDDNPEVNDHLKNATDSTNSMLHNLVAVADWLNARGFGDIRFRVTIAPEDDSSEERRPKG